MYEIEKINRIREGDFDFLTIGPDGRLFADIWNFKSPGIDSHELPFKMGPKTRIRDYREKGPEWKYKLKHK